MYIKTACIAILAVGLTITTASANEPRRDTIGEIVRATLVSPREQHERLARQYLYTLRTGQSQDPIDYMLLLLHLEHGMLEPEDIGTTIDDLRKLRPKSATPTPVY